MQFYEQAIKQANSLDAKALAAALTGMKVNTPFGADGTITMRDDHNDDRLRHRLGPNHAEGAVHRRCEDRRLGQDHRA